MNKPELLVAKVQIARQYQRSIRLDADLGRQDALDGYVCHGTVKAVLENMAQQVLGSEQRAFTWTGPFGGGKSALALTFASTLISDQSLRSRARERLLPELLKLLDDAFPVTLGWRVVPVSGRRTSIVAEISRALNAAMGQDVVDPRKTSAAQLLGAIVSAAKSTATDGLLLVVDEMGKFLEASALQGDDIHFLQDLAEMAARSNGRMLVIGILHQAFRQYAYRLGQTTRDDWAKVQGRFSDIPLVTASDEVVELVAQAMTTDIKHKWTKEASCVIAESIRHRRPSIGSEFALRLDACWPLHPAMAALLGPVSKRAFGQNERSTFGFLTSPEPCGFKAFLERNHATAKAWYRPSEYWDFLRANLESAIMASPDGHRWAQAVEAVERVEARDNPLRISLIKNIAIIDLFRNGSGLVASREVLGALHPDATQKEISAALDDLSTWRTAVLRRHLGTWSIFEGSDFDIDSAISKTRSAMGELDIAMLTKMAGLQPVVAKRHYHQSGTLRWMDVSLALLRPIASAEEFARAQTQGFGRYVLAIPDCDTSQEVAKRQLRKLSVGLPIGFIVGLPPNHEQIVELGLELIALKNIDDTTHEISSDSVARRELAARIAASRSSLEDALRNGIDDADWLIKGHWIKGAKLSRTASDLADHIYDEAPILRSELVNRNQISGNAVKARRDLLHRMLAAEDTANLGLAGWPAERGLHETILSIPTLHRQDLEGKWRLLPPTADDPAKFSHMWARTDAIIGDGANRVSVTEIYKRWSLAPLGVCKGVMPILLTAYYLSRKERLAVYKDGMFIPRLSDTDIDECLQDPSRFSIRQVALDADRVAILNGVGQILVELGRSATLTDPLEAARGLVALIYSLPDWVKRTRMLSAQATTLRDTLLRASDPHKLLFVDLRTSMGATSTQDFLDELRLPLCELSVAFEAMLRRIESAMLSGLDATAANLDELRSRATVVAGISGDFRLDAYATRLSQYDGATEGLEGILSLASNTPPRLWNDNDIDAALLEIGAWATRFRQAEALACVRGRAPTREAFAVVVGAADSAKTMSYVFDIANRDKALVAELASNITQSMIQRGLSKDIVLAVLAEASLSMVAADGGIA